MHDENLRKLIICANVDHARAALSQNALALDSKTAVLAGSYREPARTTTLHTCDISSCVSSRSLSSHEAVATEVVIDLMATEQVDAGASVALLRATDPARRWKERGATASERQAPRVSIVRAGARSLGF